MVGRLCVGRISNILLYLWCPIVLCRMQGITSLHGVLYAWNNQVLSSVNVNWSGMHTQASQTLRLTPPLLPITSTCSLAPLQLRNVLSDSARAFSDAPERTCSSGVTCGMLPYMTCRIVKLRSSWDLCTGLQVTSRAAETSLQLCRWLGAVFPQQWLFGFHYVKAFHLSYSSLWQVRDSLHHKMPCIVSLSIAIYIHTGNQAADGSWV